jgi:hypothetical protein
VQNTGYVRLLRVVMIMIPSFITLLNPDSITYNLKGSDDGVKHSDLLGFWALPIVCNSKY